MSVEFSHLLKGQEALIAVSFHEISINNLPANSLH